MVNIPTGAVMDPYYHPEQHVEKYVKAYADAYTEALDLDETQRLEAQHEALRAEFEALKETISHYYLVPKTPEEDQPLTPEQINLLKHPYVRNTLRKLIEPSK